MIISLVFVGEFSSAVILDEAVLLEKLNWEKFPKCKSFGLDLIVDLFTLNAEIEINAEFKGTEYPPNLLDKKNNKLTFNYVLDLEFCHHSQEQIEEEILMGYNSKFINFRFILY